MRMIKKLVKIIAFVLAALMLVLAIQSVLIVKTGHRGTDNIKGFYEMPDNSIDVLFLGSSIAFCTADPLTMYENSGITAFDMCSSVQPVELSLLCLKEAFKTQKPRVVVFETTIATKELAQDSLSYAINDIPLSREKIDSLRDMFSDCPEEIPKYIFPILQYKDRWKEIERDDFTGEPESFERYAMGAYTPNLISESPIDFSSYKADGESVIPEKNIKLIEEMKSLCEKNGAAFMFLKSTSVGWTEADTRAFEKIAKERDIPFLELYSKMEELQIDTACDFRDNSHLNRTGSKKTSVYLAQFLKENYGLADHRTDGSGSIWEENCNRRNRDYAGEHIKEIEALPEYLEAISMPGLVVAVQITGEQGENAEFVNSFSGMDMESGGSFVLKDGSVITGDEPIRPGHEYIWENYPDTICLNGYTISANREVMDLVDDGIIFVVYDGIQNKFLDAAGFDTYGGGYATRR